MSAFWHLSYVVRRSDRALADRDVVQGIERALRVAIFADGMTWKGSTHPTDTLDHSDCPEEGYNDDPTPGVRSQREGDDGAATKLLWHMNYIVLLNSDGNITKARIRAIDTELRSLLEVQGLEIAGGEFHNSTNAATMECPWEYGHISGEQVPVRE